MDFKVDIENAVKEEKFSIKKCVGLKSILPSNQTEKYNFIQRNMKDKEFEFFGYSLVRNTFLIELVKADISSTKYEARWSHRLTDDVRYAPFDDCCNICGKIVDIVYNLDSKDFSLLKEFLNTKNLNAVSYEMPLDYNDRFYYPIHNEKNVDLFLNEDIKKCIKLRKIIEDNSISKECNLLQKVLKEKIKIKTYLTDRVLTGDYKTNREKRWECHPNSVQYALRRNCIKIETKLLLQIATFSGVDSRFVNKLQDEGLLPAKYNFFKCPITGDTIQYEDFEKNVLTPIHGKSKFQVGHLNPLKATYTDGANGHTAENISWISENGNRIQGSLALDEVDNLLRRIYKNRPELRE